MRSLPLLVLLMAAPAAAFDVVSTTPSPYALHVASTLTDIAVTFDAPPLSAPAGVVRVAGTMSGPHSGTLQLVGNTLTFTVQGAWFPGELVHVNVRRDLASAGGTLTHGHYFAFTTRSGASPASWSTAVTYHAADVPYFIFGGDLDEDGTPDVASPNEGTDNFSVWLNQGDGTLGARSDYGVGQVPSSCFGEDFDNDGDIDLATADISSGTVTVSMNDGSGVFTNATSYAAGITTRQIHGGDFDGDNDIDLCATSYGTDKVFLYTNLGSGVYSGGLQFGAVAPGPFAIRTGDLNGDGRLDIAVACQDSDSVTVLTNTGFGVFAAAGRYRTGDGPWCLNGNDMDGDGDFDLVTVASFMNRVQTIYNDGTGAFPTRFGAVTGSFPLGVFVADLDGDGDQDVTSSNFSAGTVGVYKNPGNGQIALDATLDLHRSGSYTWAHDLDGDGDLDLSVVDELADSLFVFTNQPPTDAPVVTAPRVRPVLLAAPNPVPPGSAVLIQGEGLGPHARIDVFSLAGRRIRTLLDGELAPGGVSWNGKDAGGRALPAGAYFVRARGPLGEATTVVRIIR